MHQRQVYLKIMEVKVMLQQRVASLTLMLIRLNCGVSKVVYYYDLQSTN